MTETERRGSLAIALQEILTAVARVRANRQNVADAASFRTHVKQLLSTGHEEARRTGYASEDVKLAVYAIAVFLDESILNSPHPALAGWSRRPLQEELFGEHMGGEVFFENLRGLIARQDSEDLADLLEVYLLCLLLGFRGRYGASGQGEVQRWAGAAAEKIARIRGGPPPLAPDGLPAPREALPARGDPWLRPLLYVAGGASVAALVFLIVFNLYLDSWITDQLRTLAR